MAWNGFVGRCVGIVSWISGVVESMVIRCSLKRPCVGPEAHEIEVPVVALGRSRRKQRKWTVIDHIVEGLSLKKEIVQLPHDPNVMLD